MNNNVFIRGIGVGMAVGTALGVALTPKRKCLIKKSTASKAMRAVADAMDNVTDMMGF